MTTIEIKHCSVCPFGLYHMGAQSEFFDCDYDRDNVRRVITSYNDEILSADEKPIPGNCPLKTEPVLIKLK